MDKFKINYERVPDLLVSDEARLTLLAINLQGYLKRETLGEDRAVEFTRLASWIYIYSWLENTQENWKEQNNPERSDYDEFMEYIMKNQDYLQKLAIKVTPIDVLKAHLIKNVREDT